MLSPPFEGDAPARNLFDHGAPGESVGVGAQLSFWGGTVYGTPQHGGYDWELPYGHRVLAAAEGVVLRAGVGRSFWCPLLDRWVSDQVGVRMAHVGANGERFETSYQHLSQVSVAVGDTVKPGAVIGAAGNSGCSTGPHLHFGVFEVMGEGKRAVDPYGWQGPGADPRLSNPEGWPSRWLWHDGVAPRIYQERRRPGNVEEADASAVVIAAVRYAGFRDDLHPSNEVVELRLDYRFSDGPTVDLSGWTVGLRRGRSTTLPPGSVVAEDRPFRLRSGPGRSDPRTAWTGRGGAVWPDEGGLVVLSDPSGDVVDELRYGLGSHLPDPRPRPAGETVATPCAGSTCVALPVGGTITELVWNEEGDRLAVVVGERLGVVSITPAGVVVGMVEAETGGMGAPLDPRHPSWLHDDVLVFTALGATGRRGLRYVSPGLAAGWMRGSVDAAPVRSVSARGGVVLFTQEHGPGVFLYRWRPGEGAPERLSGDRREELWPTHHPTEDAVLFERAGEVYIQRSDGKPRRVASGVDDGRPAWGRGHALWFSDAGLVGQERAAVTTLIAGARRPAHGALAVSTDGRWAAGMTEHGVTVAEVDTELRWSPALLGDPVAVAVASGDHPRLAVAIAAGSGSVLHLMEPTSGE